MDGFQIVAHYRRNQNKAARLISQIQSEGYKADAIRADLAKPAEVDRMMIRIRKKYGRLDLLINNAGTYRPTPSCAPLPRTGNQGWMAPPPPPFT